MKTEQYFYHLSVLIDGAEDLELEQELDEVIRRHLSGKRAQLVSSASEPLAGENYGQCVSCGAWVSDRSAPDSVRAFSDGAKIAGKWYCDLCLPQGHPKAF